MTELVTAVADVSAGAIRVEGRDAAKLLQAVVSNDVERLAEGEACYALLLTPKGRIVADMEILRTGPERFLVLTEAPAHDVVSLTLRRYRLASKAEIADAREEVAVLLLPGATRAPADVDGDVVPGPLGPRLVVRRDAFEAAWQALAAAGAQPVGEDAVEALRVRAGVPRLGSELDETVFPAEAGVVSRAISFTKGCYVGQEPVARLHYRGHPNRSLRRLLFDGEPPSLPAVLHADGRQVGRVTSVARDSEGTAIGLGYVRREVADGDAVEVEGEAGERLRARVEALPAAAGSVA